MKKPAFQFYPGDWMKDPELRSVSVAARGLWIDMLCLMFESSQRGYLLINGKAPSEMQLTRMVGCTGDELNRYLNELKDAGVVSLTGTLVLFSRRMVRDAEISNKRSKCGKMGGNPNLLNQNASKTQAKRKQTFNQNQTPSSSTSVKENLTKENWGIERGMFKSDAEWIFRVCQSNNVSVRDFDLLAEKFLDDIELKEDFKPVKDLKRHFVSWISYHKDSGIREKKMVV